LTPAVLVTGASSGIGEELAYAFAADGSQLILTGRSVDDLTRVAQTIVAAGGVAPLCIPLDLAERDAADRLAHRIREAGFVIRERDAADRLAHRIREAGFVIRDLVNNAGFGLAGPVAELPRAGQLGIVDVNCRALLDLTLVFMPDLVATRGGVLNVASVAAFTAGPGLAVYYASKAFVLSFSRALRFELRPSGVRVTALCPGPTATKFGSRAGFGGSAASAFAARLDARAVALAGLSGYRAGRAVVVPGMLNKALVGAVSILPPALVLPILARIQRQRRSAKHGAVA
jgi:short-subunit dehydrogenase